MLCQKVESCRKYSKSCWGRFQTLNYSVLIAVVFARCGCPCSLSSMWKEWSYLMLSLQMHQCTLSQQRASLGGNEWWGASGTLQGGTFPWAAVGAGDNCYRCLPQGRRHPWGTQRVSTPVLLYLNAVCSDLMLVWAYMHPEIHSVICCVWCVMQLHILGSRGGGIDPTVDTTDTKVGICIRTRVAR